MLPVVNLASGKHRVTLECHQPGAIAAQAQLRWTNGAGATCANATTGVATGSLFPDWRNQTPRSVRLLERRVAEPTFVLPLREPGVTASRLLRVRLDGSAVDQQLRLRHLGPADATGDAQGQRESHNCSKRRPQRIVTSGYDVAYAYYPASGTGSTATICGVTNVPQYGLPKSITPFGIAATTTSYDVAAGRSPRQRPQGPPAASTTAKDASPPRPRRARRRPPPSPTTRPGLVRSVTNANGTVANVYNESGQLIDTTDTYGAELEVIYNKDGNPTKRRMATGPLASSTVYDTDYSYNENGQLIKQIFLPTLGTPANRTYEFSWDARGLLKATKYPNSTLSWNDYLPTGWLSAVSNRHGVLLAAAVERERAARLDRQHERAVGLHVHLPRRWPQGVGNPVRAGLRRHRRCDQLHVRHCGTTGGRFGCVRAYLLLRPQLEPN